MTTTTARVLALIAPGGLQDEVLRLAAAAGRDLELSVDPAGARVPWASAPLVLLDEAAAHRCAAAGLPRRDGVLVVTDGGANDSLWRSAVAVGAEQVVALPDGERFLISTLGERLENADAGGRVLAVLGGRGGAGASILAAAVGRTAVAAGRRGLLVDCDGLGGGLDLVLGMEERAGLRWSGVALTGGRVAVSALREALPSADAQGLLTVLSCGRDETAPSAQAVTAVLEAGARAGDTVVCDTARSISEATIAALDRADLAVLVVPAEVRACAAAASMLSALGRRAEGLQLVVRGPAPGGLRASDVADALGLPLLVSMRPQPGLAATLERGTFRLVSRSPLATAARHVLAALDGPTARRAAA